MSIQISIMALARHIARRNADIEDASILSIRFKPVLSIRSNWLALCFSRDERIRGAIR
ncbi:hypothetical protein FHX57_007644 [Paraburkholderia tropica]|uniref:hypothetical protein n=1 Tax=Paraburkholderia tropica TaxID=92647 RepID=UPI00161ADAC9|nr:hypothetical protein [Paraburkholderia tropica]MBB3005256.1 hypothetical protein [Paraburkholderia tropica]MBB6324189.1 hypothetical protein [Paraburkholderia tropica]